MVTDFDVHAMWLCRHVEQYFVALEETGFISRPFGVAQSLISVTGIPIDPVFMEAKDQRAMRRKHGLDPDRFTILVSAGGFGVGPVGHMMQALSRIFASCAGGGGVRPERGTPAQLTAQGEGTQTTLERVLHGGGIHDRDG